MDFGISTHLKNHRYTENKKYCHIKIVWRIYLNGEISHYYSQKILLRLVFKYSFLVKLRFFQILYQPFPGSFHGRGLVWASSINGMVVTVAVQPTLRLQGS